MTTWFKQMTDYGFSEDQDFRTILSESTGGRPKQDHIITLDMALFPVKATRTKMSGYKTTSPKIAWLRWQPHQPRSLFYGNNKTRRDSHAPGLYSHRHRRLLDAVGFVHRQIPTNQDNGPNKLCTGHKNFDASTRSLNRVLPALNPSLSSATNVNPPSGSASSKNLSPLSTIIVT